MTDSKLYYTPPTNEISEEVKEKAIIVWKTYDDDFGYVTDKVNRVEGITNVDDNLMYIIALFDDNNMKRLASLLSDEARKAIRDRMIDGGSPLELIVF